VSNADLAAGATRRCQFAVEPAQESLARSSQTQISVQHRGNLSRTTGTRFPVRDRCADAWLKSSGLGTGRIDLLATPFVLTLRIRFEVSGTFWERFLTYKAP